MLRGKRNLLIVGTGGHSKVVLDCALAERKYDDIAFLAEDSKGASPIKGYLHFDECKTDMWRLVEKYHYAIVAIGDNKIRLSKSQYMHSIGMKLATLIHPFAVVSPFASIGEGTVIFANTVVNSSAEIGKACILNTSSVVEHDCVLEDGVHLSPGAVIGGNTHVGKTSRLCIGSKVSNNIYIGQDVVIGAGAMVLDNIPNDVLAVGIPATVKKIYN